MKNEQQARSGEPLCRSVFKNGACTTGALTRKWIELINQLEKSGDLIQMETRS